MPNREETDHEPENPACAMVNQESDSHAIVADTSSSKTELTVPVFDSKASITDATSLDTRSHTRSGSWMLNRIHQSLFGPAKRMDQHVSIVSSRLSAIIDSSTG